MKPAKKRRIISNLIGLVIFVATASLGYCQDLSPSPSKVATMKPNNFHDEINELRVKLATQKKDLDDFKTQIEEKANKDDKKSDETMKMSKTSLFISSIVSIAGWFGYPIISEWNKQRKSNTAAKDS